MAGKSSYALGWRDWESQHIRFKALAGIADISGCSVFDAGCGYGDLLPYLLKLYPAISYTSVWNKCPELAALEANRRYRGWPGVNFISGNFITMPIPPGTTMYLQADH